MILSVIYIKIKKKVPNKKIQNYQMIKNILHFIIGNLIMNGESKFKAAAQLNSRRMSKLFYKIEA